MEPINIYVLGAGASKEHGAPMTDEILNYALTQTGNPDDARLNLVKDFLKNVFHFDSTIAGITWKDYPGLVDVLSVVDMALDRRESLASIYNQEKLRNVRKALEYSIFRALEHSLADVNLNKSNATWQLVSTFIPENTVVISFNYDVIVDNALVRRFRQRVKAERLDARGLESDDIHDIMGINYGVGFANIPPPQPSPPTFRLFKLHGSFNWLWSPVTDDLYFGGLGKAIGVLYLNDERANQAVDIGYFYESKHNPFAEDTRVLEPILITPTQLKDLRNAHLTQLWRMAQEAIRAATSITFIGYSLPGDDLHIKYLFKRAIETRLISNRPKIIVVNKDEGIKQTYQRFFGSEVEFYGKSFGQYMREDFRH